MTTVPQLQTDGRLTAAVSRNAQSVLEAKCRNITNTKFLTYLVDFVVLNDFHHTSCPRSW